MRHQGYGSLWDCSARGGNTYTYCVSRVECEPGMSMHISGFSLVLMTLLDAKGMPVASINSRISYPSSF